MRSWIGLLNAKNDFLYFVKSILQIVSSSRKAFSESRRVLRLTQLSMLDLAGNEVNNTVFRRSIP